MPQNVVKALFFRNSLKSYTHKKVIVDLLRLYVLYVLLAMVIMTGLKDKLILFPYQDVSWKPIVKDMESKFNCQAQELKFKAKDGSLLSALYIKSKDPKVDKVAIVSHGNAGNLGHRIGLASYLLLACSSVLLYDYRAFGESEGQAKLGNIIEDGLSAYDYTANTLGYKPENIILYGESIGCGVTTSIMNERKASAVILQSPFVSLMKTARDKLFFLCTVPDLVTGKEQLDNLAAVKKAHPPLLIMHGDKDFTLPGKYSDELFAAASEPKQLFIVKGAGHNDVYSDPKNGVLGALKNFIQGLPKQPSQTESKAALKALQEI